MPILPTSLIHEVKCGLMIDAGRGHIPGRVDIAERPAVVEKLRIGDWELDTIIGARHRGALLSSVDRASWFTILELLAGKAAAPVTEALLERLGPHRDRVHTLTADNGKEFAGHEEVAAGLDAGFYFATPYHSWERGLNEHVNGLVRQYFPKGTDFRRVTAEQVREVEDRLNHRPRKVLGYRTPHEVFHGGPAPPARGGVALRTGTGAALYRLSFLKIDKLSNRATTRPFNTLYSREGF